MAHENATPRPWRTTKTQPNVICNEGGNHWIARATIGKGSPRFIQDAGIAAANAALIVEAVNAYDTLRAENERLREYAREATKAITSLTAGGSEYFGRKIGDIYTADLPFCLERIQRSKDLLHSLIKDERARTKAAEATIDRMIAERAALSEAQS